MKRVKLTREYPDQQISRKETQNDNILKYQKALCGQSKQILQLLA